ncbi:MAG TPA: LTA synthase family protein [Gallionella sp.]
MSDFNMRGVLHRATLAMLHAWVVVLCTTLALSVLRAGQIVYHWPAGFHAQWSDLFSVLFQGGRFDLKAGATAGLLLFPLFAIAPRRAGWVAGAFTIVLVLLSLINLHYFGFYKTPIDPIVFGFFEDDTKAIVQTVWSDFPVVLTLLTLAVLSTAAIAGSRLLYRRLEPVLVPASRPAWVMITVILLAFVLLVFSIKGTLRSIGLVRQNLTVTTSQFLNDMVPNGAIALLFAWDQREESQDLRDPMAGLHRLGFDTPLAAARVLGIEVGDEESLRQAMYARGSGLAPAAKKKNLLFFMMESWSAEPFLYQSPAFDVLGRLEQVLPDACHFSNFDSAQGGTHPTLEAVLFSTPITPLSTGREGKTPLPWSVPLLLKQAGYETVFITSGRSGWRDMNRVMKTQGFDEIVDALTLQQAYPEAELGIWGVWDGYAFKYLGERLERQSGKPLFAFVMTMTNHPPYDLPPDYDRVKLDMEQWGGERNSADLGINLETYRYSTDLLGGLVQKVKAGPHHADTVIAATGDHNTRTFGVYATPERRYLVNQVPFVVWGGGVPCGKQLNAPASHRDMFPTLFPLVGVDGGYVNTGRNLLRNDARTPLNEPRSVSFDGHARNAQGAWQLGNPASFVCTPVKAGTQCRFDRRDDAEERARLGLLDWFIRSSLHQR